MPVVNSSISTAAKSKLDATTVITPVKRVPTGLPIVPIYANEPELARAILNDIPYTAVNPVNGAVTNELPKSDAIGLQVPAVITDPHSIDVSYNSTFGDWLKANPMLAAGGGLFLAYGIYYLTSKRRRK